MRRFTKIFARPVAAFLIAFFVVFSVGATPRPAAAQLVVTDPITGAAVTLRNVGDYFLRILGGGAVVAVMNAAGYFAQKLAYDAAVYIAAGGKGQGPLFEYRNVGDYLTDNLLGAAGDALGTLNEMGFAGFNLCDPSGVGAPQFKIRVLLGIGANFSSPNGPKPKCEWSDISANWEKFSRSLSSGEVLRRASFAFEPGQSQLGVASQSFFKIGELAANKANNALKDLEIGQGFKALTNPIAGTVKTPSQVVRQEAAGIPENARRAQQGQLQVVGPALAQGALSILPAALGTFVNTLSSKLLGQLFKKGLFDLGSLACRAGANLATCRGALQNPEFAGRGGESAARAAFADFITPAVQSQQQYDAISEFSVCPDQFRTPSNCVMDERFAAGVRQSRIDKPLTVRDAIAQGFLHGDWPLVASSGADEGKNQDPYCFASGYCYGNLQKLRKARIIPIGWELAAVKAQNGSPTLKDAIAGFNDCPTEASPNPADHPWCKLIDPDWVLVYPATQCRARVYGPTLISGESDLRAQTCVDAPSCIAEDEKGNCVANYGYCTREKNVWQLGGNSCPTAYATCGSFRSRSGASLTALANTLDYGICTAENAGCRGYSVSQDPGDGAGDWNQDARVFLSAASARCDARDAGCSEVFNARDVRLNLIVNSSLEDGITGWRATGRGLTTVVNDAAQAFHGSRSVQIGAVTALQQTFTVEPETRYALSFYARSQVAPGANTVKVYVTVFNGRGTTIDPATIETTCRRDAGGIFLSGAPAGTTYERFSCNLVTPDRARDPRTAQISASVEGDGRVTIDAFQFEGGASATAYHVEPFGNRPAPNYLKLPPAFLNCTGEAGDPEECKSYAQICRPSEVGCELYSPTDGTPAVPGMIGDANRCPAACIGYATYRQEESSFDVAAYPLYLIASTARQCTAAAAGCSEFTNLDALASGGESRAYFSELRACRKSDDSAARVYYTWEGSEAAGFQLKEWKLIKSEADAGPALISPAFADACTRDIFRLPAGAPRANPDCREFYNADGAVFYRLYSKTIVATDDCHPYRITALPTDAGRTPAEVCAAKGGEWRAAGNECVFQGYPAESRSCAAAENGCRLYVGNAGRNVRDIFFDDFENANRSGWGADADTAVSTESVAQGGHSLRINRGARQAVKPIQPVQGKTYVLSFWGKGRGSASVKFAGAPNPQKFFADRSVELRENWNVYTLGPVTVDWSVAATESLQIVSTDGRGFPDAVFIDKIQLREVTGTSALIKNSWQTPAVCDQSADGAPLPQAMLGCRAYRDRAGQVASVTGFANICRPQAVGCTALTKTQQSESVGLETWNALCVGAPGACSAGGVERCTVPIGRGSCRYKTAGASAGIVGCPATVDGIPIKARADGSCAAVDEVIVPSDATVYAVPTPQTQCVAEKAGCTTAGLPHTAVCRLPAPAAGPTPCLIRGSTACTVQNGETSCSYPLPSREPYPAGTNISYETVTVKNDPRTYNRTLCTVDAVGCDAWDSAGREGAVSYFKNPDDRLCAYREGVRVGAGTFNGWFREGTDTACDPDYVLGGNFNGIRRNGDAEYAGFAGKCSPEFAGCTEFRDPADGGKAYYYLKNDKLDTVSCNGQASPKAGCVLFDDTSNPARTWNAQASNLVSKKENNALVNAVSCPDGATCGKKCLYRANVNFGELASQQYRWGGLCNEAVDCAPAAAGDDAALGCRENTDGLPRLVGNGPAPRETVNDADTAIKVKQSRQCGEWLACQSSTSVWDSRENRFKEICDQIGLCDTFSTTEPGRCLHWVTDRKPEILTEDVYRNRDTSFAGMEYSGYSIPLNFPTETLSQVNASGTLWLARVLGDCKPPNDRDGNACEVETSPGVTERGNCYGKKCSQAIHAAPTGLPEPLRASGDSPNALSASCRAYPEQNSPFPFSVKEKSGFQNAKTCEEGQSCECSYQKIVYGNGSFTKYFGITTDIPANRGYCQGGTFDKQLCDPSARGARDEENLSCIIALDDQNPGTCQSLNKKNPVRGLDGYCLEKDTAVSLNANPDTKACLTWLPTDRLSGSIDIYNQYASAGFALTSNFMCVEPAVSKTIGVGRSKCSEVNDESGCGGSDEILDDLLDDSGIEEIRCAPGYFVVVTRCKDPGASVSCGDGKVGYRCVPTGSLHETGGADDPNPDDAGKLCDPNSDRRLQLIHDGLTIGRETVGGQDDWQDWKRNRKSIPLYFITEDDANTLKTYDDCKLHGVDYNASYFANEDATYDFSCKLLAQTGTPDPVSPSPNKAWTNRLWSGGDFRLDASDAPLLSASCLLGAACAPEAGRSSCPCERGGVFVCNVVRDARDCTGTVNLLSYSAKTPPTTPPLLTFGPATLETTDPTQETVPVGLPSCRLVRDGAEHVLPLPESSACFDGYDSQGSVDGRPYLYIATARASDPTCDGDADCNPGAQCGRDAAGRDVHQCFNECVDDAGCGPGGSCVDHICANSNGIADRDTCLRDPSRVWLGQCSNGLGRCETDGQCFANECVPRGAYGSQCKPKNGGRPPLEVTAESEVSAPGGSITDEQAARAARRIQQLFAKAFGVWQWMPTRTQTPALVQEPVPVITPGTYVPVTNDIIVTDIAGGIGKPPTVRAIGTRCDDSGKCTEGDTTSVTVNNQSRGDLTGGSGAKFVTLKFYGFADDNQMPIRKVLVDWNDGSPIVDSPGSYKNHRGFRSGAGGAPEVTECDGTTFGRTSGACDASPFTYNHSYSCAVSAPEDLPDCTAARPSNCWDAGANHGRGACKFIPRVQLKDNWGFCNGRCEGAPGREFCYDDLPNGGRNECDVSGADLRVRNLDHWTTFAGQVLVSPP